MLLFACQILYPCFYGFLSRAYFVRFIWWFWYIVFYMRVRPYRHGFRIIVYVFIFRKMFPNLSFFSYSNTLMPFWGSTINHQFQIVIKCEINKSFGRLLFVCSGCKLTHNDSKTECVLHSIPSIMDIHLQLKYMYTISIWILNRLEIYMWINRKSCGFKSVTLL